MDVTIRIERMDELITAINNLVRAGVKMPEPAQTPQAAAVPVQAPQVAAVPVQAPQAAAVPVQAPQVAAVPVQAPQVAAEPVQAPQAAAVPVQAPQVAAVPVQNQPASSSYSAQIAQNTQTPVQAMTGAPPAKPGIPTTAVVQEYTQDQIARALAALADTKNPGTVSQILAAFGVQELTQVPKDRYPELVLKIREAGANI